MTWTLKLEDFTSPPGEDEEGTVPDWNRFRLIVDSQRENLSPQEVLSAQWLIDMLTLSEPKTKGVTELHHIVPKGVGGHHTRKENLIHLKASNHLLAHERMAFLFPNTSLQQTLAFMARGGEEGADRLASRDWNSVSAIDILKDQALIDAFS
jgi:hypothetical protein